MSKQDDSAEKKEEPKKVGNIPILQNFATLNQEQNNVIGQIFTPPPEPGVDGKPPKAKPRTGRDEILYFGLGVDKQDSKDIYSKEYQEKYAKDPNLVEYKKVNKYYKDADGKIQDYKDGQELKDNGEKIAAIVSNLGKEYADKHYTHAFKEEMIQALGAEYKKLGKLSGAMMSENLSQVKDKINEEINNEIRPIVKGLRDNPKFNESGNAKLKDQLKMMDDPVGWQNDRSFVHAEAVKAMLDDPRMQRPENAKLRAEIAAFVQSVENDNKAILESGGTKKTQFSPFAYKLRSKILEESLAQKSEYGKEISKGLLALAQDVDLGEPGNYRKAVQAFTKSCEEQGLLNGKGEPSASLNVIKYKTEQDIFPLIEKNYEGKYSNMLKSSEGILRELQKIEKRFEKQPPIAYGATVGIEGEKPTHAEYVKAITKLIVDQKQITGLDPNSTTFKIDLAKLSPKELGKIEIAFEHGKDAVAYKIAPEDFIKIMQKMDLELIRKMDPENIRKTNPELVDKATGAINDRGFRDNVKDNIKTAGISEESLAGSFEKRNQKKIEKIVEKGKRESAVVESEAPQVQKNDSKPNIDAKNIVFPEDVRKIAEAERAKDVKKFHPALEVGSAKQRARTSPETADKAEPIPVQSKPKRPGPLTEKELNVLKRRPLSPQELEELKASQNKPARPASLPPEKNELKAQQAQEKPVSQASVKNNETSVAKPEVEEQKKGKPSLAKQVEGIGYDLINALRDKATPLIEKSGLDEVYDKIKGVLVAFKDDPKLTMKGIKEETKDALVGVKNDAKEALKTAKEDVKELAKANLSDQDYKRLKEGKKKLETSAQEIHDKLNKYLPGKGGEHSPKPKPEKKNEMQR